MAKKILGTRDQYYIQTNDGSVALFKDYFQKSKMIACGPNSAVMCADIAGWPQDVWTLHVQASDVLLMLFENPNNLNMWKAIRNLNYDVYPPNEVPQLYPKALELVYGKDVCQFVEGGLSLDVIKAAVDEGRPLQICGKFPCGGHYVSCVGYDGDKVVINDPYPANWGGNGYNHKIAWTDLNVFIDKWYLKYFTYE